MARRRDRQPNQRKAYSKHHERVAAYTQEVNRLFDEMVAQAVHLVGIFEGMEDTPALERALQGLKKTFAERMLANISLGMMNEWSAASRVQDELLRRVLGERFPEKYTLNRPQALEAFLKRKTAGLSLSQRVWKLAGQAEEELTTAIAVGLSDGLSAHELSREVRKYLQDPDKLFRRVRDDEGDLKLSKPAKAYRPGQGVYRSSHKNALRLTRTEINMAYRRGEQSRWQEMDFVVGYEVKRSGTGYPCPVCEALAGKYPKDFVWSTWHPHCRCYAIPILKTEDELFDDSNKPSINEVKEPHEGFQRWVKEQEGRIKLYAQRGTLPLFLKENKQALRLLKGEKWSNEQPASTPNTPQPPNSRLIAQARARHAKRTPQQIEDIKKRWEERNRMLRIRTAVKPHYETLADVDETFKIINDNLKAGERWFENGDLKLSYTTEKDVNGSTAMDGRVFLKEDRLRRTKVALGKIGAGKADTITFEEADAMATFWHEITHNRNIHGHMRLTEEQVAVMEMMNEFVARKTLPEFYSTLGCHDTPYPEFITNRASTAYNKRVIGYDFVIQKLGLDKDKVLASAKKNLFGLEYTNQETTAIQALLDGGLDKFVGANGKKIGKRQLKKIIVFCRSGYHKETIELYMANEGIIPIKK